MRARTQAVCVCVCVCVCVFACVCRESAGQSADHDRGLGREVRSCRLKPSIRVIKPSIRVIKPSIRVIQRQLTSESSSLSVRGLISRR